MIFTTRSERYEDHIGASSASTTAQASGMIQPKERVRASAGMLFDVTMGASA